MRKQYDYSNPIHVVSPPNQSRKLHSWAHAPSTLIAKQLLRFKVEKLQYTYV